MRLLSFFLVLTLCLSPTPYARAAGSSGGGGVAATVQTDNAQVYARPDFDSDVIATLPSGARVRVSHGTTGQYAKFYKVRAGPKLGYIADIDVNVEGSRSTDAKSLTKKHKAKTETAKNKAPKKHDRPRNNLPMYFSRFIGVEVGGAEFKEDIAGVNATTTLITYGLKVTGPDVLISGPVLDFNLQLHYGAPDYYNALSTVKPTGYVLYSDLLFLLPFFQAQNAVGLLGVGPLAVYSSFNVFNAFHVQDLTTLNVGVSLMAGVGVRTGGVAFRLEGKYMIEKHSNKAIQLSIQTEY